LDYRTLIEGYDFDKMLSVWSEYKALMDREMGLLSEEDTTSLQDDVLESDRIYDLFKKLLED
jgi:hypothetical protein